MSSRGRSALLAAGLLLVAVGIVAAVGRNAPGSAPDTYVDLVGRWDASVDASIREARTEPLIDASRVLNLVGGSLVLVPLRLAVLLLLAALRSFSAFFAFGITWAITQPATEGLKAWLHRGRPPEALIEVSSFAMPSGHAVAFTSVAVAAAIALTAGRWRGWLVIAGFLAGAVMGVSRLVLSAHWLSDVAVGVLFGGGVAIASAVFVDLVAQWVPDRTPDGAPFRRGRG